MSCMRPTELIQSLYCDVLSQTVLGYFNHEHFLNHASSASVRSSQAICWPELEM
jgi:hypothetical protein